MWWWALGALVLFIVIGGVAAAANRGAVDYDALTERLRGRRPPREAFGDRADDAAAPLKRAAVIVNPTKFDDLPDVRARVAGICAANGWAAPSWHETTIADPGTGQARAAVAEGVDLVCALGGDGTVRAFAKGLIGGEVPMALLPAGTGNLLARNLDLPSDSMERALLVALTGQNKTIDVGQVVIDRGESAELTTDQFLVMAGLGFDATVMAGTDEALKKKVGMAAYIVTGLQNMKGPQFKVRVSVDGGMEFTRRTQTVLIGNCGKLFGGLVLMPEAKVDDGLIDAVLLSPKGVVGWTAVAARVVSRRRKGHAIVDHHTGTEIRVKTDRPKDLQLDGDIVAEAVSVTASVLPRALVVRVAQPTS